MCQRQRAAHHHTTASRLLQVHLCSKSSTHLSARPPESAGRAAHSRALRTGRHVEANRDTMLQQWYGAFRFAGGGGPNFLLLGNTFRPGTVDAIFELTPYTPPTPPPVPHAAPGRLGQEYVVPLSREEYNDEATHAVRHYDDAQYAAEHVRGEWVMRQGQRGLRAGIVLRREERARLLELLRADTEFLARHGVSGYTLLVGVQARPSARARTRAGAAGGRSPPPRRCSRCPTWGDTDCFTAALHRLYTGFTQAINRLFTSSSASSSGRGTAARRRLGCQPQPRAAAATTAPRPF